MKCLGGEREYAARRKTGRPRKRWIYCIKEDLVEKGLEERGVSDRCKWRRQRGTATPYERWEKLKMKGRRIRAEGDVLKRG